MPSDAESQPLLGTNGTHKPATYFDALRAKISPKKFVGAVVAIVFIVGSVVLVTEYAKWRESLKDPYNAALYLLDKHPVFDTHIDLPWLVRAAYRNNASAVNLDETIKGHVDIPRLRAGRTGGFFWSVFTPCPGDNDWAMQDPSNIEKDFLTPTNSVRDTLEQIDIAHELIARFSSDFSLALNARETRTVISKKKFASLLGIEGGHQLGNSLAALRQFYKLGVRYVTLTHSCHNAFADSAGIFVPPEPLHGGLSPFGEVLIREMNRLGMIVDLSHTSDDTAIQAIKLSKAPVLWSHSSARSVWNVPRNVPDHILKLIGTGPGKKDGVIQVNFAPFFVAGTGNATVEVVADHVDWIGKVAGRQHVGLGSDFDGIGEVPKGLEDVSAYPNLFAELIRRGWTSSELAGLAGGNFLRIFDGVEATAAKLKHELRAEDIYYRRTDL